MEDVSQFLSTIICIVSLPKKMKISIVYCQYYHKKFNENLATVDDDFGRYTPISICYIASIMEQEGHEVMIVDAYAEKLTKEEILQRLIKFQPDLLAISMHSAYSIHDVLPVLKYLKKNLNKQVLVGGYNFNLYPFENMFHECIDYGIIGDNIDSLPKFLKFYDGKRNLEDLKEIIGMCYRENGKIVINLNPMANNIRLGKLPLPARHLLKSGLYFQFISKRKNFALMVTQTGCPYPCTFCAVPGYKFGMLSPKQVLKEIELAYHKHGVREIDFFDALFTVSKDRVHKICELIIEKKLNLHWSCRSRIDTVNEDLLIKMAKAGCKRIYYGIESVDQNVLDNVKKRLDARKVRGVINMTQKHGIMALGFFMIGNPGETRESVLANIEFSTSLNLKYVQWSIAIPKPNTPLEREYIEKTGEDFWKGYMMGEIEEKKFKNIWCNLPDEEMHKLLTLAYRKFYFRPKILIYHILKIRSFEEFERYVKTGLKILNEKFDRVHWSEKLFNTEENNIGLIKDSSSMEKEKKPIIENDLLSGLKSKVSNVSQKN